VITRLPGILTTAQAAEALRALEGARWGDGRVTAGTQSAKAKHNDQVAEDDPIARTLGDTILASLERNPLFVSAALPARVFPPLFNRYAGGQTFGTHIDNAVRTIRGTVQRVRTDLSATLFLTAPDSYDGGELVIEDTYGVHAVKLAAGDMVLYPASSLHHVRPVTRGARVASFFWIQSMVRDDGDRALLFDLDSAIRRLNAENASSPVAVQLTGVYHNLLRKWAEV
jgi:PKHD-type hydroxylase